MLKYIISTFSLWVLNLFSDYPVSLLIAFSESRLKCELLNIYSEYPPIKNIIKMLNK